MQDCVFSAPAESGCEGILKHFEYMDIGLRLTMCDNDAGEPCTAYIVLSMTMKSLERRLRCRKAKDNDHMVKDMQIVRWRGPERNIYRRPVEGSSKHSPVDHPSRSGRRLVSLQDGTQVILYLQPSEINPGLHHRTFQ
jgi:hypothetical protein